MIVSNDEYGAPWNDKYYNVTYIDQDGDMIEEVMVLDGPREYSYEDLRHEAEWRYNCKKIINIWSS